MTDVISCPACNVKQWEVQQTYMDNGFLRRLYKCGPCECQWATIEVPIGLIPSLPDLGRRAIQAQAAVDRLVDALRAAGVKTKGDAG